MVSRPTTDLPTHGLCSWRREGSLHQQQSGYLGEIYIAIKITEDALRHIGRDAHFFRAGLGGSAYITVAHFGQIPGSNRPCVGERGLVRRASEAMAVCINHQFKTISA